MNIFRQKKLTSACICLLLLSAILWSCTPASHCFIGSEITIPSTDTSPPTIVAIDFHMPDGTVVSRVPGDGQPTLITVPINGDVTVNVAVEDAQGVKDAQLFAGEVTCSIDPATDTASCSGPPLLSGPTASNPESNAVGQVGCTRRLVTQKVSISNTSTGSTSMEISAKGINFGGQEIRTTIFKLSR